MTIKYIFLLLYLFTAVLEDFRSCKIPNRWILIGLVAGVLSLLEEDRGACPDYIMGCVFPFILLFFFYCIRVLGAGDIKVFMICGLFLGTDAIVHVIVWAFFFGGIYAVIRLIRTKSFRKRFLCFFAYAKQVARTGRIGRYVEEGWEKESVLHFSLCIFLGCLPVIGGML